MYTDFQKMSRMNKGPVIDPGQCRCCGATKKCRLLNVEYEYIGQKEVYSDMFVDTFGLILSNLDADISERVICATCVSRLRDAGSFRCQVLRCEQKLLQATLQDQEELTEIKQEKEFKEDVKEEAEMNMADNVTVEYDDYDDIPLASFDKGLKLTKEKPRKPKKKSSKKEKKPKTKGVKGKINKTKDKLKAQRELLLQMQVLEEQLEGLQQNEPRKPVRSKIQDDDHMALQNTITIVENSYVCPFDTSFSDYYCIYCRQVYTDPNELREHTLTHDPTSFKDTVANTTKKIIQIDIVRIDCRLCPLKIDDLDSFRNHLVSHGKQLFYVTNKFLQFRLTQNNLTCTECDSTFSFFHALKKHMAEHFGSCICDICGSHYFEERMLILHMKSHQRSDESFPCKECEKTFKSKHSRYLHEARTHKKEPAYQCPKCDEVFFSYTLRYRHMIKAHGENRMFKCDHCDRCYDSRKSLREHNRRFHLKIFKHQCDLCDKRFYLPSRLKEHIATHTGERNYRCEYCGKSYPRLRGLKVHMQSHSSEKKFRCVLCSAAFTQNVNLKNHVKRQHQGVDVDGFQD